jgi:N-acetyl-anhydromuramyl-L-alanine amidase AmpD
MLTINQLDFPTEQYLHDETVKNQIVLHHTASHAYSIEGDLDWWKQTKERVATHFIIGYDGRIYQLYDLKKWAYHVNLASVGNQILREYRTFEQSTKINRGSVGIELDCAGALTKRNGRYVPWFHKEVSEYEVCKLAKPYRGTLYFQRYSDEQISSLKLLLEKLITDLNIDLSAWHKKDIQSIFEIDERAFTGQSGIFTHSAYDSNKQDCYPDSRLIAMLSSISKSRKIN